MKKKLTAILSVLLILSLCLTLAACGGKSSKSDAKETEAVTEKATEAPTEEPTEAPTEEPTEEPTEAPTEASITWDEAAQGYIVSGKLVQLEGISDDISFLSEFQTQYLPEVRQWAVLTISIPEGLSTSDLSPFLNCITVAGCEQKLTSEKFDSETQLITQYQILYDAPYDFDYSMESVHVDLP